MDAVKEESNTSANASKSKLRYPLRSVNKQKRHADDAGRANTPKSGPVNVKDKGLLPPQIPIVASIKREGRKGAKENREGVNAEAFVKLMELSRMSLAKIEENALVARNTRVEFRGKIDLLFLQAENEPRKIEYKIMEKDLDSVSDPVSRAYFARKQEEIIGKLRLESSIGHGIG